MLYEIILDIGETGNKCTIAPLAGREDFRLFPVLGEEGPLGPLSAPVLLHHEGECLTRLPPQATPALASIDCIWRRLPKLLDRVVWAAPPVLAKIPPGFVTAYPRVGRDDPNGGLATIEALFTAAALLGNWDPTLFSQYYFGRRYVELNAERFCELGVKEAGQPELWPKPVLPARDAWSRRRNRGRLPQTV